VEGVDGAGHDNPLAPMQKDSRWLHVPARCNNTHES
jgi:hypothetical protein